MKKTTSLIIIISVTYACSKLQYPAKSTPTILHNYKSLEDSAINESHETNLGIDNGWNIYKDILFPGTNIEGTLSTNQTILRDNKVLNCRITVGNAYNNLFFTYTLAKKWMKEKWYYGEANAFAYSMDFFIDNYINCNAPDQAELEGLEFTFQQAKPPDSFLWGLQWSKSNVWSYWDDTKINQRAKGWIKIPELNACMYYRKWNHIYISGHRTSKGLYYDKLIINDISININKYVPRSALPPGWNENYLQAGFQINGNKAIRRDHTSGLDPASVYLNNVQFEIVRL